MERIVILDFGSQYTQLICRRIRELKVYCEVLPCETAASFLDDSRTPPLNQGRDESRSLKGIILSGGPASVYDKKAPLYDGKIFDLGVPTLGICYGLQVMAHLFKGEVKKAWKREYGRANLYIDDDSDLFKDLTPRNTIHESHITRMPVWMSHGDVVEKLPPGFQRIH